MGAEEHGSGLPEVGTLNIGQSIKTALAHQHAGRLQQAAEIYQRVLQQAPDTADALHLLGLIQHQTGNLEAAIDLISRAIEIAPEALYYCNAGLVLSELGQADVALACYEKALELQPGFVDALNNMGNLMQAQGRFEAAIESYRAALAVKPDYAQAYYNLGNTRMAQGDLEAAIACYNDALRYQPFYPEAHNNIGVVLVKLGRNKDALPNYQQALEQLPDFADAHSNLGSALEKLGRYDEAREHLLRALELRPENADALCNLGSLKRSMGQLDAAIEDFRQALSLNPSHAEAYNNLGMLLADLGRYKEAMQLYRKAVEINPDFPIAYNNMAVVHREFCEFRECIVASEKALSLKQDFADPYINIGNALSPLGQFVEAREAYRKALEIEPGHAGAYSNLIFTMLYDNRIMPDELYRENLKFAERFEAPFRASWPRHENSCTAGRRLKVGYVSADFRNHAVASFIELVLKKHNHTQFEIYCYYNHAIQDHVTERLRKLADHWMQCHALDDDQLTAQILADGIDILVDLSGHSAHNRLPVFARKPAPVQVTWMGYVGTTGLSAMDYRFTEPYLDPVGMSERYYSEKLVYLPSAPVIFQPEPDSPDVNDLPALAGNGFTFASLNNTSKLNEQVIALWSRILQAVSGSRLLLGNVLASQETWLIELFGRYGIGRERLMFQPRLPILDYLASHHRIDLALDPFPYNGGTTTFHSLWMGVPVLTLAGNTSISRVGASIMNGYGLPQFVTESEDAYFGRAVQLASDLTELGDLRHALRSCITSNASCDAASYTHAVETAYQAMWQQWCAQQ